MSPQAFAQIIITLSVVAAGFSLFLNFLLLLMEEIKNYSIMDRKKERKPRRVPDRAALFWGQPGFGKRPGAMVEM